MYIYKFPVVFTRRELFQYVGYNGRRGYFTHARNRQLDCATTNYLTAARGRIGCNGPRTEKPSQDERTNCYRPTPELILMFYKRV